MLSAIRWARVGSRGIPRPTLAHTALTTPYSYHPVEATTTTHASLHTTPSTPSTPSTSSYTQEGVDTALAELRALTRKSPAARAARATALANGKIRNLLNQLAHAAGAPLSSSPPPVAAAAEVEAGGGGTGTTSVGVEVGMMSAEQMVALCEDLIPLAPYKHRLYAALPAMAAARADELDLGQQIKLGWIFSKLGSDASADAGYIVGVAQSALSAPADALGPKDLALLGWCLTKASLNAPHHIGPQVAEAGVKVLSRLIEDYPLTPSAGLEPRSVSVLLWSLVNARVPNLPPSVLEELAEYTIKAHSTFSSRDLVSTLWGLTKLGRVRPDMFALLGQDNVLPRVLAGSDEDLVSLLWCLGQIPSHDPEFAGVEDPLKAAALRAVTSRVPRLKTRQLARVATAAGHFEPDGSVPVPLLASIAQRVADLPQDSVTPQEVANIAYSLGRGYAAASPKSRDMVFPVLSKAFARVSSLVPRVLDGLTAQGLANVAYAFAKAGVGHSRLIGDLATRLAQGHVLATASPSEMVMTVWALSASGGSGTPAFATLLGDLLETRIKSLTPQEVSILAWSLRTLAQSARARHDPETSAFVFDGFETLAEAMRGSLHAYPMRSICANAFAFAKADHSSMTQFVLFTDIQSEVMKRVDQAAPRDLANIAWACSRSSSFSQPFFEFLFDVIVDSLDAFPSVSLKQVISAVTQTQSLTFDVSHPVFAALDETLASRMSEFSPGWLTAALVSFARAGIPFPAVRNKLLSSTSSLSSPSSSSAPESLTGAGEDSALKAFRGFHAPMGLAWALLVDNDHVPDATVHTLAEVMVDALVSDTSGPGLHVLRGLATSNLVRALVVLSETGILASSPHVLAMFEDAIRADPDAFWSGFGSHLVPLDRAEVEALLAAARTPVKPPRKPSRHAPPKPAKARKPLSSTK